jgi:hypothetical protein
MPFVYNYLYGFRIEGRLHPAEAVEERFPTKTFDENFIQRPGDDKVSEIPYVVDTG